MSPRMNPLYAANEWSTIVPVRVDGAARADAAPMIATTALAIVALVLAALLLGV